MVCQATLTLVVVCQTNFNSGRGSSGDVNSGRGLSDDFNSDRGLSRILIFYNSWFVRGDFDNFDYPAKVKLCL